MMIGVLEVTVRTMEVADLSVGVDVDVDVGEEVVNFKAQEAKSLLMNWWLSRCAGLNGVNLPTNLTSIPEYGTCSQRP
jgi:hypothetical protein